MDVADDDAERIGEQHRVRHLIAEAIHDVCGPAFPALLLLVSKRIGDLFRIQCGRDTAPAACRQAPQL